MPPNVERIVDDRMGCSVLLPLLQSRVRNAVAPRTVAKTVINEITMTMNGWKVI
jgi:hypothetical protein